MTIHLFKHLWVIGNPTLHAGSAAGSRLARSLRKRPLSTLGYPFPPGVPDKHKHVTLVIIQAWLTMTKMIRHFIRYVGASLVLILHHINHHNYNSNKITSHERRQKAGDYHDDIKALMEKVREMQEAESSAENKDVRSDGDVYVSKPEEEEASEMANIYNSQKARIQHNTINRYRRRRKMDGRYGSQELHKKCASAGLLIQINTKGLGLHTAVFSLTHC
ncbi:hypothetical protein PGT21_001221 [Puccinia graminis f. sp. tritici]|uniref:Uncharacterized protein n=1 Tax=Puccinia graminis f. sp. tritici TaxID=56615 RepID=A0A5B0LSI4_PUCGR|nr:hypothetical protein PGT21_001221 [Puccinia graminis f. sp. tritici]